MKRTTILALALLAPFAASQADLVIKQKVETNATGSQMTMDMAMKFKGDKIRMDVGEQSTTIVDGAASEIINIMHPQKMVMRMDSGQIKAMQEQMQQLGQQADGEQEESKLEPTGESREINGYQTEEYVQKSSKGTTHYWIAKDYPNKDKILKEMSKLEESELGKMGGPNSGTAFKEMPGIPLQTIVEQGGQKSTMTVQAIEETDIDASEFEIPEGYKEMNMPALGDMLKQKTGE